MLVCQLKLGLGSNGPPDGLILEAGTWSRPAWRKPTMSSTMLTRSAPPLAFGLGGTRTMTPTSSSRFCICQAQKGGLAVTLAVNATPQPLVHQTCWSLEGSMKRAARSEERRVGHKGG